MTERERFLYVIGMSVSIFGYLSCKNYFQTIQLLGKLEVIRSLYHQPPSPPDQKELVKQMIYPQTVETWSLNPCESAFSENSQDS